MKTYISIFAAIFVLCLWSCSPSTRITGSRTKPQLQPNAINGRTVLIASLTRNMEVRTKLENAFADQANMHNIKVVKSSTTFSPDFYQQLPSERQLLTQIKNVGAD